MTREAFIRKWLGKGQYTPENRDKMREDLDSVIELYTTQSKTNDYRKH